MREVLVISGLLIQMSLIATEPVRSEEGPDELMDRKLMESYDRHFHMPIIREGERKMLVMLTLVDAVWRLSYTKHRGITVEYKCEAILVPVSYCRNFLPEVIDSKESRELEGDANSYKWLNSLNNIGNIYRLAL